MSHADLIARLTTRASIRRTIDTRKSVAEGSEDRLANLLDEAAAALSEADAGIERLKALLLWIRECVVYDASEAARRIDAALEEKC